MKALILITLISTSSAHAEMQAETSSHTSTASKSAEPSLSKLFECARASSPHMLNINKYEGVVAWTPQGLDNYLDDGSNVVAVSMWSEPGQVSEKSGFITVTDKQLFFTPVELEKERGPYATGKSVDIQLRASSLPMQSRGFRIQTYHRDDDFSTAFDAILPEDNPKVITNDHALLGNDAENAKRIVTEQLRSRIKNSAVALTEYSKLLSREPRHSEIMIFRKNGPAVEMTTPKDWFGKIPKKRELSQDDVQKYRAAYCECENVFPNEVEEARKFLTSDKAFIRMRQRNEVRKLEAADLRCGQS